MSEAKLTEQARRYFKELTKTERVFWTKISDRYTSGLCDFYLIVNGTSLWIELKATGEKPRPIQEHTMQKIRNAGGTAVYFDSFEDLKAFVEEFYGLK